MSDSNLKCLCEVRKGEHTVERVRDIDGIFKGMNLPKGKDWQ